MNACLFLTENIWEWYHQQWNCYRKISNMEDTKSQNSYDSHLVLKSSLPNPLKPGGRLNKKDGLTRYGDSHVKDKTS